ncbi:MAG: GTPase ObgE [Clostridiales bacterium]|nr:GTPase ObgE [Clostridiales bacterium]
MFFDRAKIIVKAGDGGNGLVSFHTEKNVPNGGPDGGDGGKGGDVIIVATDTLSSLRTFRFKRKFSAENGENGKNKKRAGKGGEDLRIEVPVGTVISDAQTKEVLADLTENGAEYVIAKGGKGGHGNIHFVHSVRQAPRFARVGTPGEEMEISVELKLIADVGLVGLPNAGKSTLLSVISAAKPKIADYPFTTLEPILGVVYADDTQFVVADIPGIIEGASGGAGLGLDFLRHIERTMLLIHVVDVSVQEEGRDPIRDFEQISEELALYKSGLERRPRIVAASKTDLADPDTLSRFVSAMNERGLDVFPISAATTQGTKELIRAVAAMLPEIPKPTETETTQKERLYKYEEKTLFTVSRDDDVYVVEGDLIQSLAGSINFEDPESLSYFQRMIRKKGIVDALKEAGIQEGDTVRMYDIEFEYID